MFVTKMPDGKLLLRMRAEGKGIVGDLQVIIDEDDPRYPEMLAEIEPNSVNRGGPGSGHYGHAGRPGEVGGSEAGEGGGTGKSYRGGTIVPLTDFERSQIAQAMEYFGEEGDPAKTLSMSGEVPKGKFPIHDPETGEVVWLTGGRDPVLSHVEDQYRGYKIEVGTAILEDGTLISRAVGTQDTIPYTDDQVKEMQDAIDSGEPVIFTHNHPGIEGYPEIRSMTLSSVDVSTALTMGFSEVRATSGSRTYYFRIKDIDLARSEKDLIMETAMVAVDSELQESGIDRKSFAGFDANIDEVHAYVEAFHEAWTSVAEIYPDLIEYGFEENK